MPLLRKPYKYQHLAKWLLKTNIQQMNGNERYLSAQMNGTRALPFRANEWNASVTFPRKSMERERKKRPFRANQWKPSDTFPRKWMETERYFSAQRNGTRALHVPFRRNTTNGQVPSVGGLVCCWVVDRYTTTDCCLDIKQKARWIVGGDWPFMQR